MINNGFILLVLYFDIKNGTYIKTNNQIIKIAKKIILFWEMGIITDNIARMQQPKRQKKK